MHNVICFHSLGYACQTLMKGWKVKGFTKENIFLKINSDDFLCTCRFSVKLLKPRVRTRLTEGQGHSILSLFCIWIFLGIIMRFNTFIQFSLEFSFMFLRLFVFHVLLSLSHPCVFCGSLSCPLCLFPQPCLCFSLPLSLPLTPSVFRLPFTVPMFLSLCYIALAPLPSVSRLP